MMKTRITILEIKFVIKIKVAIFLSIFLLGLIVFANGQEEVWRKIKIAQSTKDDVEQILGKPYVDKGYFTGYYLENGGLYIEYSLGLCKPNQMYWWNLSEGVVREITIVPLIAPKYKSLKIDRKKFKKTIEGDVIDHVTYINEEEGVKYVVVPKGVVSSVTYFPSKKYDSILCSNLNN